MKEMNVHKPSEFCEVADLQPGDITSYGVVQYVSDIDDTNHVVITFYDREFSVKFRAFRELRIYN